MAHGPARCCLHMRGCIRTLNHYNPKASGYQEREARKNTPRTFALGVPPAPPAEELPPSSGGRDTPDDTPKALRERGAIGSPKGEPRDQGNASSGAIRGSRLTQKRGDAPIPSQSRRRADVTAPPRGSQGRLCGWRGTTPHPPSASREIGGCHLLLK